MEEGESVEAAALRELNEELGVAPEAVQTVGRLSPIHVFGSGFFVTPVIGVCDAAPRFVPNPDEVSDLLEIPTGDLLNHANHGRHLRSFGERSPVQIQAGHIQFQSHRIWGATALVLAELMEVLRTAPVRGD